MERLMRTNNGSVFLRYPIRTNTRGRYQQWALNILAWQPWIDWSLYSHCIRLYYLKPATENLAEMCVPVRISASMNTNLRFFVPGLGKWKEKDSRPQLIQTSKAEVGFEGLEKYILFLENRRYHLMINQLY